MLELWLVQGSLLKKVLEVIRELVTDANFDCSGTRFSLVAMDSSHVALVALLLRSEGFEHYYYDRNLSMGMNLNSMAKMLHCAGNNDIITIKADDGSDIVTFMFESPNQDKIVDFEMKIMDIDSEHLGIPDSEYQAIVRMMSAEFLRICEDLSNIRDTSQTVHFVDEHYDAGRTLAQRVLPVLANDTPEQLAARVLNEEHKVYVEAVAALCEDRIVWREDGVPLIRSQTNPDEYS